MPDHLSPTTAQAPPESKPKSLAIGVGCFAVLGLCLWGALKLKDSAIADLTTTLQAAADEGATKACQGYLGKAEADLAPIVKGTLARQEGDGGTRLTWTYREAARIVESRINPKFPLQSNRIPALVVTTEVVLKNGRCVAATIDAKDDEGDHAKRWFGQAHNNNLALALVN